MKKNMKRVLASFMAVAISVCFIPTMAFAADTGNVEWYDNYTHFTYNGQDYNGDNITVETKDSTCTEEGVKTYTAKVDGAVVGTHEETIAKKDHTLEIVQENVVEATCVAAGSYDEVTKCTVCKAVIKTEHKTVEATGVHKYKDAVENVVPATCKAAGSHDEVSKCEVCGKEESRVTVNDPIDPNAHVWDNGKVTKEATCDQEGEKTFTCTLCGATKTEPVEKTAHSYVEKLDITTPATCTEEGEAVRTLVCENCGAVKEGSEETVAVPATGHDWDEGVVTTPADQNTCVETGEKTYTCKTCKETKTEAFGGKEHTPKVTKIEFVPANCEQDGYAVKVTECSACGEYLGYEEVITEKANGKHVWTCGASDYITAPTCTKAGKAAAADAYCEVCGVNYKHENPDADYFEIEALGHDTVGVEPVLENNKEATCTEKGSYDKVVYCAECNEEVSRTTVETAALGHNWDEGTVTKEATCTEDGVLTYTCANDPKHTKTEAIEAKGHTFLDAADPEYYIITEPTCMKDGDILKKCTVCNKVEHEVIPALGVGAEGHAIDPSKTTTEVTTPATCTKEGVKTIKMYCEAGDLVSTATEAIPMVDHDWQFKEHKSLATSCADDGVGVEGTDVYECSVCHETKEVAVTPHEFEKVDSMSEDATCEKDGILYEKCAVCGKVNETVLPAIGHEYEKTGAVAHWSVNDPSKGYVEYTYTCKNDATHTKKENVDFAYAGAPSVDDPFPQVFRHVANPTCEEAGAIHYWVVDETSTLDEPLISGNPNEETIPATGHSTELVKRNVLDPTCTKEGSYDLVPKCTVCAKEFPEDAEHVTVDALGHTPAEEVQWVTEPDYDHAGKYNIVCDVCGDVIQSVDVPPTEHAVGKTVIEMALPENGGPTCTKDGKGYSVVYCACTDENGNPLHAPVQLSCEEIVVPAYGHQAGDPEYDSDLGCDVVYCKECEEVIDVVSNYDESVFTPEDAEKVQEAKDDLIAALNAEPYDSVAVDKALNAWESALEEAEDNAWKADIKIWFKDSANKNATYDGNAVALNSSDVTLDQDTTGEVTFTYYADEACETALESAPTEAGTYYALATVASDKNYRSKTTSKSAPAKIVIAKAAAKVTPSSKTYKVKKLKKAKKTFTIKTVGIDGAALTAAYKKSSGNKKITVSAAGKVTVKKGLKKGTYKVKVTVTPDNVNYAEQVKTITIKVKK